MTNITFENIRSKASLYGLDVDQYWQNVFTPDTGAVTLSNLTFRNITGSLADGALRPPLYLIGNDLFLTDSVTIEDFSLWTEEGSYIVNKINNIYGYGDDVYGPNDGLGVPPSGTTDVTLSTFTSSYTISASPTGWVEPAFPTWAVASTGYGSMLNPNGSLLDEIYFANTSFAAAVPIPVYTPAALWMPQGDYDKHYWGTF